MSTQYDAAVLFNDVSFAWPDGSPLLRHVTTAFGPGRTGLVGANGTGKTTLLRLIRGDLAPTAGRLTTSGNVVYLPQHVTLHADATIADLLGIRATVDALRAIELGSVDPAHFDAVGDDWDIEARTAELLETARVGGLVSDLDRRVDAMSGGETVLVAIAGLRLTGAPVVLLDEPTNNLDRDARAAVADLVRAWPGALIVVSHDVELLDLMDETAELYDASLTVYGGGYTAYREILAAEQEAARRDLADAHAVLKTERRQRVEAETKLARRARYAKTDYENKRRPRAVMKLRARDAQVSAGRLRIEAGRKVDDAAATVEAKEARVRRERRIRIDLPDPDVPASRRLAELVDADRTHVVAGPERVALTGPNGSGKTRLVHQLLYPRDDLPGPRAIRRTDRIGYLPQRIDAMAGLDDDTTLLDTVRAAAPNSTPQEVRANLARFLFRGDQVERTVGQLSGGERFRVALARILLADPPPQLIVLDEPTNSLDLNSVDELVDALSSYRGGLIVVSHDEAFLARLCLTRRFEMTTDGTLTETPPDGPASTQIVMTSDRKH